MLIFLVSSWLGHGVPRYLVEQYSGCFWDSVFFAWDWCWSWKSDTLATWCEELTHWKRPWCWERLRPGREGDDRGWDGWMASSTQRTWVWVNSGSWWWTGGLACCCSWGRKESDTTERLNWTFKSVDWVKQIASLVWVGIIQAVKGLNKTKRLILPQVRQNSSCLPPLDLKHWLLSLPAFGLELNPQLSWFSGLPETWEHYNAFTILLSHPGTIISVIYS